MNPGTNIERASRPISQTLRSEIESLWKAENVSIADVDARLAEIRYIARSDNGDLAGVCSSAVEKGIYNALYFHGMRVMVGGAYRENLLAYDMLAHLVEELGDHNRGNFQVGPVGAKVVIQTPIVAQRGEVDCARTFQFPINKKPIKFVLSGFTSNGHPEHCHYFLDDSDASRAASERWAHTTDAYCKEATVQTITPDSLAVDGNEVMTLMQQEPLLDDTAGQQQFLGNRILYSLKSNDALVAVCELVPRFIPEINSSLLGLHVHVSESSGSVDIQGCFARKIYDHLNSSSGSYTGDAVGLFVVYSDRTGLPTVCPVTEFHLHGVDVQGKELRVRFFDDQKAKVPL